MKRILMIFLPISPILLFLQTTMNLEIMESSAEMVLPVFIMLVISLILYFYHLYYNLEINKESKVSLDLKAVIGAVVGIISIAGVWFTLTAEIAQLQLDVVRMQDAVKLNEEFRVKWPRGEMGALPDDAKQDLRIQYLQDDVENLKNVVKTLEIDNAKK